MPRNRCCYESSDESSIESSNECNCKYCVKKRHNHCCKEKHRHYVNSCSQKNKRCYKKNKCSSSHNHQTLTDYCKNDCQDGKVILITIS